MVIMVILLLVGVLIIFFVVIKHAILLLFLLSLLFNHSLIFREIIQTVIHQLEKELEEAMIQSHQDNMSGCTCALVYLNNNELTIANVGDTQYILHLHLLFTTRAYLGRTDALVELTQIHDAFNDQERIKRAGGWVTTCRYIQFSFYSSKRRSTNASWFYRFPHFPFFPYTIRFNRISILSSRNSQRTSSK